MTFKEFEAMLLENRDLQNKFKEAKNEFRAADYKEQAEAVSVAIQQLGYDVPAEEIALHLIGAQALDENELDAVAGGFSGNEDCYTNQEKANNGICVYDYTDTDCGLHDYCDFMWIYYD